MKTQKAIELPLLLKEYIEEKKSLIGSRNEAIKRKIPVIDDLTGNFLASVSFIVQPKNILEIGCGTGYSTFYLLKNIKKLVSYTGIDLNKERLLEAERTINERFHTDKDILKRLDFISGNALHILPKITKKFDLVFIDGAKFEYYKYLQALNGKLMPGSVIIADNIFYKGKIFEEKDVGKHNFNSVKGLREYVDYLSTSGIFDNFFLDVADGISVSVYKE